MRRHGMTIIEVLVALVIIGIAFTILSVALVGNLRQTDRFGARTQTSQFLSYLGRLVAGGDPAALAPAGSPLTWDYGELGAAFADLPTGSGSRDDVVRYRAAIEQVSDVAFVGAVAVQYRITVCSTDVAGESCVNGTTLGPAPIVGGTAPLLPGIN
jgi:prepilin-type N-terminal cleavage/methylation domain-containing protein